MLKLPEKSAKTYSKKCLVSAFVKELMFTRPFVPLYNEESTSHSSAPQWKVGTYKSEKKVPRELNKKYQEK